MALSRTMVIAEQNELCRFACHKNYNDQVAIGNREFGAGGPPEREERRMACLLQVAICNREFGAGGPQESEERRMACLLAADKSWRLCMSGCSEAEVDR